MILLLCFEASMMNPRRQKARDFLLDAGTMIPAASSSISSCAGIVHGKRFRLCTGILRSAAECRSASDNHARANFAAALSHHITISLYHYKLTASQL